MILAITGATGFVGTETVAAASGHGHEVRALTRRLPPPPHAEHGPRIRWIEGTLETAKALEALCDGADAVLHIAGAVNAPTRAAFAAANIAGTQAVLDAATRAGVTRFVHVSSLAARAPALSNYGWSKAEGENAVTRSDRDWTIVRPPGVYGEHDHDMLELFRMAQRGIVLTPPAGRGSWIEVSDLARLLITLSSHGGAQEVYEPDDGTRDGLGGGISHRQLAMAIGEAVGRPNPRVISAPRWLLKLAARGDRLVRGDKAKLTPDRARYMAHPDWVVDPKCAVPSTLWKPETPLPIGLRATAKWYRGAGLL
jgi:nucleoside-diphosphate-sugar epimerase